MDEEVVVPICVGEASFYTPIPPRMRAVLQSQGFLT